MTIAVACAGLLGVLLFALGANVSRLRAEPGRTTQIPSDPADRLFKAIRAHGNAAEYVPVLALLMLLVAHREPGVAAAVATVAATAARFVHAAALMTAPTLAENTALRTVGAAGTYAAGLTLSVLALLTV